MGCTGAVALLLAGMLWMMFFVVLIGTGEWFAVVFVTMFASFLTLVGVAAWWVAIRPDDLEEDLFEGARGMGTTVVIVCTIALVGFFAYAASDLQYWWDMYRGWTEGSPARY
jgi:hypothetical protein